MSFVPSLLQAIVRVDGEALVMHPGDKPYVVSPTGQVELANRGLTLEAVNGVVKQLLPVELQQALEEFGAVQYELPAMPEFPGEHFTVVAARGGDDLWTEIRRRRVPDDDRVPEEFFDSRPSETAAAQAPAPPAVVSQPIAAVPAQRPPSAVILQVEAAPPPAVWHVTPLPPVAPPPVPIDSLDEELVDYLDDDDLNLPNAAQLWPRRSEPEDGEFEEQSAEIEIDLDADVGEEVEEDEADPSEWELDVAPPPVAPHRVAPPAPVVEVRTPPPAAEVRPTRHVAPPIAMVTAAIDAPVAEMAAAAPPVVAEQPLAAQAPMGRIFRAMQRHGLTASDAPPLEVPTHEVGAVAPPVVTEEPPAAVAEVRTTPWVAAPAARRTAPPPVDVPTPRVAAPVVTEQVPAPVVKVVAKESPTPAAKVVAEQAAATAAKVVAEQAAATAAKVVAEQAAATAAKVVAEQAAATAAKVVAEQAAATAAKVVADQAAATAAKVVAEQAAAAAAKVVAEQAAAAAAKVVAEQAAATAAKIVAEQAAATAAKVVAEQPPIPVTTVRPTSPVAAPPAKPIAPPPLNVPTPLVAAVVPPVVTKRSPAVQAPAASAEPPRSLPPVPLPAPPPMAPLSAGVREEPFGSRGAPPLPPAVVLPISRSSVRSDQPVFVVSDPTLSGLERLLRVSAARGASTLYLSSGSRPSVRVDGELQILDAEPAHVSRDVESLLLTLMPERNHEALRTGAATEWIVDIEGVGRVRCMSFRDHLGPGGVFRLMPTRSISADQLGLPRQVQALASEPEGLVLVTGPRSSGKRTLIAAFVDLMNRTRRDHIITIEREINIVHQHGRSFISQREVRGNDDEMLAAARGALREDPDVIVIEDLRTGPLMNVALDAAASGRLVVGGFSAHTATGAIDRIIDLYAPEYRRQVQLALADSLRGVIVQTLLKKIGGGRLPAREVLLNTPAVSSVIAEGKTSQLPMAIEGGRRYGMMPLNDTLVGLVQNGSVEAREAYRRSPDRPGFLAALNRQGLDTSFVERLA